MWLSRAATATSTAPLTRPPATLPQLTLETQSSTHPRRIAPTTPTNSKICSGQVVPSMLDAARLRAQLTTPTRLLVVWLRLVSSSTHTSSRAMERTPGSIALSTNKLSLRRPRLAQALSSMVLLTHTDTLTPPPMPLRPVVPLSLVRLPRLRGSLALPLFKDSAPRCWDSMHLPPHRQ